MKHTLSSIAAVTVTVLALSGCSALGSASAKPVARSYAKVALLKSDVIAKAHYKCAHWNQNNQVAGATGSGTCSDSDVFMTFSSKAGVTGVVDDLAGFAKELVVGPNWVVNPDTNAHAKVIAAALGGKLVDESKKTAASIPTPTPTPNAFAYEDQFPALKLKIRSKQCFGSAGCNVTVEPHSFQSLKPRRP